MPVPLQVKGRLLTPFLITPGDPDFQRPYYSVLVIPAAEDIPGIEVAIRTAVEAKSGKPKTPYRSGVWTRRALGVPSFKCYADAKPFFCDAAGAPGEPPSSFFEGQTAEVGLEVLVVKFTGILEYWIAFELKAIRLTSESTVYREPSYEWKAS